MKVWGFFLGFIALVIGGALLWFFSHWDYEVLRYRLTYQIGVGDEIKTGSAVTQIRWEDTSQLPLPNTGVGNSVRGEAIVIDLGNERLLFSLLKGQTFKSDPNELVIHAFDLTHERFRRIGLLERIRMQKKSTTKGNLDLTEVPLLVTFADINDPKTVQRVDPDDLDGVFACSKVQLASDFPWRAQGRTWRQWNAINAYREAQINAGAVAGLPEDVGHYEALWKLNWYKNQNSQGNKSSPEKMDPPAGYEADQSQLATLHEALVSKYGEKELKALKRKANRDRVFHRLQKTYLARTRDTSNDCHRIKSITLEITDEPVTTGRVEKVLGWWLDQRSGPYNEMISLKLPSSGPRGWVNLSALNFWSYGQLKKLKGTAK